MTKSFEEKKQKARTEWEAMSENEQAYHAYISEHKKVWWDECPANVIEGALEGMRRNGAPAALIAAIEEGTVGLRG